MKKSTLWKGIALTVAVVIAFFLVWKLIAFLAVFAVKFALTALIVGGVGYLIYRAVAKSSRSLPGRDRTPLP